MNLQMNLNYLPLETSGCRVPAGTQVYDWLLFFSHGSCRLSGLSPSSARSRVKEVVHIAIAAGDTVQFAKYV